MTACAIPKTRSFPKASHIMWIILSVIAARASYYTLTDGFSVHKIENTFPLEKEWKLDPPSSREQKLLKSISAKPFTYLGKGSQAYAFLSDDKAHVLKLFKCYHLTPVDWLTKVPLPAQLGSWREETKARRQKKIDDTLKSYQIAATLLRDECGLIAMEILPTPKFQQAATLADKLGRIHTIDLSQYGFVMQRRADLIYPCLSQWIASNDLSKAKQALRSIVALLVHRSKKGIQDSDPDLHKNAGLIGTTAIFIDIGSFHSNPQISKPENYIPDILKITNKLHIWLQKQSPELATYLHEEIKNAEDQRWRRP